MFKIMVKNLKVSQRGILIALVWWAFFIYLNGTEPWNSAFPFTILSLVLIFQELFVDDKNKIESLYVSLPVKRWDIVNARYLTALVMMVGMIILTNFSSLLLNRMLPETFTGFVPLKNLVGSHIVAVYFLVLLLPFFFKYGAHLESGLKAISIMTAILLVVLTTVLIIALNNDIVFLKVENIILYAGMPAVILTAGSWLVSQRIYSKREF